MTLANGQGAFFVLILECAMYYPEKLLITMEAHYTKTRVRMVQSLLSPLPYHISVVVALQDH